MYNLLFMRVHIGGGFNKMAYLLSWLVPASVVGFLTWTVFVVSFFQICSRLVKRWREDILLKNFPGPHPHWLFGNAHEVVKQRLENFTKWCTDYGSPFCVRMDPFRNVVVLTDPESMRALFATSEPKEGRSYNILEGWIGDGLLLSAGQKWARHRKLLTPAFHFQTLKPYARVFSSSTLIMINIWKDSIKHGASQFEMFEHIGLMVLDSLLMCAYGTTETIQLEGKKNPYIKAVYDLGELVMDRYSNPLLQNEFVYKLTHSGYKFRKACRTVHQYSQRIIRARKNAKQEGDVQEERPKRYLDFLDILLEAKDTDGRGLTDEEIQHEVDTFMFEGHDTTGSGLSYFLFNMAKHPEHQQQCVEEIRNVLGERDNVTWDDMAKLDYLTMCIKESLRTHPPVIGTARRPTQPITLPDGKVIPTGTWTMGIIWALHRNPAVWEDPYQFDPLRFMAENSKNRSPHAYLPFAAGPRNCIGQNFAMGELKACAALLLKHFEFSVYEEPEVLWQIVLRAKNGIWLTVKERR